MKYYYMMLKREEDKKMTCEAQRISLRCTNECRNILKKVTEQVCRLSLLNKSYLKLDDNDIRENNLIKQSKFDTIDEEFTIKTPIGKNINTRDLNNEDTLTDSELKVKVSNILKKNNTSENEDIYDEIDIIFRDHTNIFNSYIRDNYIKFSHIFKDLI